MLGRLFYLVALAGGLYGGLALVGGWLWLWLRRVDADGWLPPAPVLGLAVVQIAAWWWSDLLDAGLDTLFPVLLTVTTVATIGSLVVHRTWVRERAARAEPWVTLGGSAALATALFGFVTRRLVERSPLSIASSNNDYPFLAQMADLLARDGFSSSGPIPAVDLGPVARGDVPGTYNLVGFAEWMLRRDAFEVALPAFLVLCVLLAQVTAGFLRRQTDLPNGIVALIAVVPQSAFLFAYSLVNYFGSHFVGLLYTMTWVAVLLDGVPPRRSRWVASIAVLAVTGAGLLTTYPHMLFLLTPVVLAAAVLRRGDDHPARVRVLAVAALGGAGAALLVLERAVVAFDRLIRLGGPTDQWGHPAVPPLAVVGLQGSWSGTMTVATVVGSVVLVAAAIVAGRALAGEQGWRLPVAGLLGLGLASYLGVYVSRGGPDYVQWKWISYLQPLLAVVVLAPVVAWVLRRFTQRATAALVATGLVALIVVNVTLTEDLHERRDRSAQFVTAELGELGAEPDLADVDEVNIDLSPFWESMWAAVAVAPRTVYFGEDTYYGPGGETSAEWTLVAAERVPPGAPDGDVRVLNARYALVRGGAVPPG